MTRILCPKTDGVSTKNDADFVHLQESDKGRGRQGLSNEMTLVREICYEQHEMLYDFIRLCTRKTRFYTRKTPLVGSVRTVYATPYS